MNKEAQNALLKLLEEPPEKTVFIMTTSRPRLLLPTVLSRVQKLHIVVPQSSVVHAAFVANGYEKTEVQKAQLAAVTS